MSKNQRTYTLAPEHLDDMSPAQRAVISEMILQHERVNWFIMDHLPSEGKTFVLMRLKMMGLDKDELWMYITDRLAKMEPDRFDKLLIELDHFVRLGMRAKADATAAKSDAAVSPEPE